MRYVYLCLEQLGRAAEELAEENSISSRLALILTDNVVELVCRGRCEDIATFDSGSVSPIPMIGSYFKEKLSFLSQRDEISETERIYIATAHRYRNDSYHIGLMHDEVIYPIAWHYHEIACDLFGRLKPRGIRHSYSGDPQTPRVRKYLWQLGWQFRWLDLDIEPHHLEVLARLINQRRPTLSEPLARRLSRSLKNITGEIAGNIYVLTVEGSAIPFNYRWLASSLRPPADRTWQSDLKGIPVKQWHARASAIETESSPSKALAKYEAIVRDMLSWAKRVEKTAPYLAEFLRAEIEHKQRGDSPGYTYYPAGGS